MTESVPCLRDALIENIKKPRLENFKTLRLEQVNLLSSTGLFLLENKSLKAKYVWFKIIRLSLIETNLFAVKL
jgi:hypothetical protein